MKKTFLIYICSITFSFGQAKVNLEEYRKQYPNNDIVNLNSKEEVTVKIEDGKVVIYSNHFNQNLYLNNKASVYQLADESIVYSPFFQEINNVEAATYIPSDKGVKKMSVKDIVTEKQNSKGVFFDDYLVKKFTYLGLQQGAVSTLKYEETIKNPYMMPRYTFGNYIPMENSEFSVTFPSNIKVGYKKLGDFSNIKFTESQAKGKTTYTWKASNIKETTYEAKSLSLQYFAPSVQLLIENYTINNVTQEVLSDENRLFKYYVSLVKNINPKPEKEFETLVDSLTKDKTDIEKIKSVYYWVQDYVKYIAFEDGMGGFIPRPANQVFTKRYGDCKDMANLIHTMLKTANVKDIYLGWIGTRDIPFKYSENPTMSVDNHMIAVAKVDNKYVFLDATDDRIDYGLPTNHIQGKECMVMIDENEFKILEVPVVAANLNIRKDNIKLKISGNEVLGKGNTTLDGLWKSEVKYNLSNCSEKQKQEYNENFLRVGNNKTKMSPVGISNLTEREKNIGFEYSYSIPDFIKKIDNEIYFNPHLYTHLTADNTMAKSRKTPFVNNYTWREESNVEIEIPENHQISYIPESVNFINPNFGFVISYEKKSNTILLKQQTYVNKLVLEKAEFEEWNKMIAKLTTAHSELIGFIKK